MSRLLGKKFMHDLYNRHMTRHYFFDRLYCKNLNLDDSINNGYAGVWFVTASCELDLQWFIF